MKERCRNKAETVRASGMRQEDGDLIQHSFSLHNVIGSGSGSEGSVRSRRQLIPKVVHRAQARTFCRRRFLNLSFRPALGSLRSIAAQKNIIRMIRLRSIGVNRV